jgi:NAD(P)-dependent dehydrogenase (short-subunit alcohol dehydrogenase family)
VTVIITGANRRLGHETSLALAAETECTIVLAGPDLPSLVKAAQRIQYTTSNGNLLPMQLDLAALASAWAFAAAFRNDHLPPLKSVIGNAGISKPTVREHSADGYEATFAFKHLGRFLLVHLLLDRLQPLARILVVSSRAHGLPAGGYP